MQRCEAARARGTAEEKNISSWLKGPRTRKGNAGEDELWGPRGRRCQGETEGKREKVGNAEGARLLFLIIKNGTAAQMRGIFATRASERAEIHPVWGERSKTLVWSDPGHLMKTETGEETRWPHTDKHPTGKMTVQVQVPSQQQRRVVEGRQSRLECRPNVTGLTGERSVSVEDRQVIYLQVI